MSHHKLPIHELGAVIVLSALILSLTLISNFRGSSSLEQVAAIPHFVSSPEVEVSIQGAVEHPGSYQLPRGALVQDLLELAKPLPNADLKRIRGTTKLRNGKTVNVPEIAKIEIFLQGAVQQKGALNVAKGTVLRDLIDMVEFEPDADLKPLQKKRKLRDQETITVGRVVGTD
jgi:hypothetical protein